VETSGLLRLSYAPDCVRPAAIDVLGSRVELSEICFAPIGSGPASGGASNSEEPIGGAAPGDDEDSGAGGSDPSGSSGACTFQALSRVGGAGGWAFALLVLAWAAGRRLRIR
jgi:hypothetical protein